MKHTFEGGEMLELSRSVNINHLTWRVEGDVYQVNLDDDELNILIGLLKVWQIDQQAAK